MRLFKSMMRNRTVVAAMLCALLLVGGAWAARTRLLRGSKPSFDVTSVLPKSVKQSGNPTQVFDTGTLAEFNGKNNAKCYVAIDTTVYEIAQGLLWQDGEHTTSGGLAMCGKDLTEAIKQSPHGRSKLNGLPIVGSFTP